ncbi:hypothetical protein WMY93_010561 [Mugilogobius chulae]|uniref:Uncharacterized protein n=1 Tax=Mugilogobius chulae TaxID=88201 RepID=A0AAW0PGL5_9GOBI
MLLYVPAGHRYDGETLPGGRNVCSKVIKDLDALIRAQEFHESLRNSSENGQACSTPLLFLSTETLPEKEKVIFSADYNCQANNVPSAEFEYTWAGQIWNRRRPLTFSHNSAVHTTPTPTLPKLAQQFVWLLCTTSPPRHHLLSKTGPLLLTTST